MANQGPRGQRGSGSTNRPAAGGHVSRDEQRRRPIGAPLPHPPGSRPLPASPRAMAEWQRPAPISARDPASGGGTSGRPRPRWTAEDGGGRGGRGGAAGRRGPAQRPGHQRPQPRAPRPRPLPRAQPSPVQHQFAMPAVPAPEELLTQDELIHKYLQDPNLVEKYRQGLNKMLAQNVPIEIKPVNPPDVFHWQPQEPKQLFWVRARGYIGGSRGLVHGRLWRRDGVLAVTCAQEGVIRVAETPIESKL